MQLAALIISSSHSDSKVIDHLISRVWELMPMGLLLPSIGTHLVLTLVCGLCGLEEGVQ